jgi:UDP-N-acetylmuramate--alanine ligase
MNALMAPMAKLFGTQPMLLQKPLHHLRGRFSYQIKTDVKVYIDDYAHHPTEINAVHQAVRVVSKSKVLAIFQPHLFSRTRDFADDFAKSLSALMKSFYWIFILHVNCLWKE